MNQEKQTRQKQVDYSTDPNSVRVKITGPTTNVVADVQDALADAFQGHIILSPILRSDPHGFHAFATIRGGSAMSVTDGLLGGDQE